MGALPQCVLQGGCCKEQGRSKAEGWMERDSKRPLLPPAIRDAATLTPAMCGKSVSFQVIAS